MMPASDRRVALERIQDAVFILAILGLFAAPYVVSLGRPLLQYLMPDALILLVVIWRFRERALRRIGLAIPARDFIVALASLAAGLLLVENMLDAITEMGGLVISGHRPFYSLTQVFHQELILHGLLLGTLASKFPLRYRVALSVALVFALIHPALYWWQWGLLLPATTTLTLFCFGLATNLLFLRAGHIAFAFAAHAAWNLIRFGTVYLRNGVPISEAESFADIEGSTIVLGASLALLLVVLLLEILAPRRIQPSVSEAD